MIKESLIFTEAEMKSLNKRLEGNKEDKSGIYASRTKPKIKEILNVWIKEKNKLEKL